MQKRLYNTLIHIVFGLIAGCIYLLIEIAWRGHTHWTMLPLAALVFVIVGLLDECKRPVSFCGQLLLGTCIATFLEFIAGCILNIHLGLGIWDYSDNPGNVLGQICPQFMLAWMALVVVCIKLENFMHNITESLCDWLERGGR